MKQLTVLSFYSDAHPRQVMADRLDIAVNELKQSLPEFQLNIIDYLSDGDRESWEIAEDRLSNTIKSSSSIVIIFAGWAQSTPVLKLLEHYFHIPIIIWSLAGYYENNQLIAPAAAAGASLLRNTLDMRGADYYVVYDNLGQASNVAEVSGYVKIFDAIRRLRDLKIASIGYACSNLFPFMYDGNLIKKFTGLSVDNVELLYLEKIAAGIDSGAIKKHSENFLNRTCPDENLDDSELQVFSRFSLALNRIISENSYSAVTIKCGSGPGELLGFTPCMLLSYLPDEIDAICECDVNNLALQVVINKLTGMKATFLEVFEFYENSVLMASCGFAPLSLCRGSCIKTFTHDWGGAGGIMNISPLKRGNISLLTMFPEGGALGIQLFKGIAKAPEKFQEEGWNNHRGPLLPALDITLLAGNTVFKKNIKGPHYIMVHKDVSEEIAIFCRTNGLRFESF